MTAEQLRMAMSMLRMTIGELAGRSGVSRGTIIRMTNDLPVMHSNRAVVKLFLESEDVVFISETSVLSETVARRR
jgi:transcriptional regulator with XRE-family HTH domain